MQTSANFEAFMEKVRETLPHFAHIQEKDALAWFASLSNDRFNDEDWHLRRLRKIGGSESGILVAPIYGEPAPFDQTPGQVFDRKLMRGVLEQNDAMRFGHEHEPVARKMYEEKMFAAGWERDTEGMERLSAFVAADSGSMAYSPDDLFVMKGPDGSVLKRLLPDYKSPFGGKVPGLRGDKVAPGFSYVVQLHHGLDVCRKAGLQVDALRLCFLDHPDNIAKPKQARLMVMDIDIDEALIAEIRKACDGMMERVRLNERPLPSHVLQADEAQQRLRQLQILQKELVKISVDERALSEREKTVREDMANIALSMFPPRQPIAINSDEWGLKIIPKISYKPIKGADEEIMKLAREMGKEEEDAGKPNPCLVYAVDMGKVAEFIQQHGAKMDDFKSLAVPNFNAITNNPEWLKAALEKDLLQASISFGVPSKLNPEDLDVMYGAIEEANGESSGTPENQIAHERSTLESVEQENTGDAVSKPSEKKAARHRRKRNAKEVTGASEATVQGHEPEGVAADGAIAPTEYAGADESVGPDFRELDEEDDIGFIGAEPGAEGHPAAALASQ